MSSVLPTHAHQNSHPSFFHMHRRTEPVGKQRKIALFLSYAPDWILTIVVAGLFFLLNAIEPFKREFSLDDTSIRYTFAVHERISDVDLVLIAVVAPLVLMAIINVISIRSFWDLHTSWLGGILALVLTGTVTSIVKVTVGRPRPDCIDRCQPRSGSANHAVFGLVNATICTQTDNAILKDGFRSFPSGHSSLSFAGLGFLSFYLAGKLHLFDERGYTDKAWIFLVPLMGAALVAISRTMDYRHHWQDVLIGGLLGLSLSWFSYRQYYPTLSHPLSHRPYSPRSSRNRPPLPRLHNHDDNHLLGEPDETDILRPPGGPHYTEHVEMELHKGSRGNGTNHTDGSVGPVEVWKQGEEAEAEPPEQTQSSRPADERV